MLDCFKLNKNMDKYIYNADNNKLSLQVSNLKNVDRSNIIFGRTVLLKNITEDNIMLKCRIGSQKELIDTIIYPGWNPELITEIQSAPLDSLQYGY